MFLTESHIDLTITSKVSKETRGNHKKLEIYLDEHAPLFTSNLQTNPTTNGRFHRCPCHGGHRIWKPRQQAANQLLRCWSLKSSAVAGVPKSTTQLEVISTNPSAVSIFLLPMCFDVLFFGQLPYDLKPLPKLSLWAPGRITPELFSFRPQSCKTCQHLSAFARALKSQRALISFDIYQSINIKAPSPIWYLSRTVSERSCGVSKSAKPSLRPPHPCRPPVQRCPGSTKGFDKTHKVQQLGDLWGT